MIYGLFVSATILFLNGSACGSGDGTGGGNIDQSGGDGGEHPLDGTGGISGELIKPVVTVGPLKITVFDEQGKRRAEVERTEFAYDSLRRLASMTHFDIDDKDPGKGVTNDF